jgi:hypothetical protein
LKSHLIIIGRQFITIFAVTIKPLAGLFSSRPSLTMFFIKSDLATKTKLAQKRLTLLQLAEKVGNVYNACQMQKLSRCQTTAPISTTADPVANFRTTIGTTDQNAGVRRGCGITSSLSISSMAGFTRQKTLRRELLSLTG